MDEKKKQILNLAIENEKARQEILEKHINNAERELSELREYCENKIKAKSLELSQLKASYDGGVKYIKTIEKLINAE